MGGRRAGNLGRVGPYTLYERLGRGGMGEVYLARDRRGRPAAVKLLRSLIEDDPAARMRLDREVRALRRVESPYVARVLDADLSGDRPYLVMDYIQGDTLLDTVRRGGPLSGSGLLELAHGLAAALAIIHAAGVVHRDLKPANVLVGAEGPVLIDFGIAHVMDATRVTDTGAFLGTPGYAAPEVFAGEPVGEPADLHAWGATVAFAATGRPTFGRGTAEAQMYAILNGQADLAGVPAALLPHIRAALHREPAKRPTAALLAGRLARLARASAAEPPASRIRRRGSSRDSWARRGEGRNPEAPRNSDGVSPADGSPQPDGAARSPDVRNSEARHSDGGRLSGARSPDGGRIPGGRDPGVREPGVRDSDAGRPVAARDGDAVRNVEPTPRSRADAARAAAARDGEAVRNVEPTPRSRAAAARDGDAMRDPGARDSDGVRSAGRVRPRRHTMIAGLPGDAVTEPRAGEGAPVLGAGVLLVALTITAVPSVVVSVVWAPATFVITAGLAVLARALWGGHWLLRGRRPGRARGVLRVLTFPLALAGALVTAVVWPGLPAVGSAALSLWLASGMREPQEWWTLPGPIALAGVVFGIVCGGLVGREVERAGMRMPELRKEGLRALAVLGGFVAVCAAAVRAVAVFF